MLYEDLNFREAYEYTPEEYESALQDLLDKAMENMRNQTDEYRASAGAGAGIESSKLLLKLNLGNKKFNLHLLYIIHKKYVTMQIHLFMIRRKGYK
ncbi:hypothetical protein AN639_11365 [Candidatus Epulonipiscium fishelsonii]|nr:hypothetical protein AN639_11365 [Epulopiscium sp. SCG-B05WGA-EpuloA1]